MKKTIYALLLVIFTGTMSIHASTVAPKQRTKREQAIALITQTLEDIFGSTTELTRRKVYLECSRKLHPDKQDQGIETLSREAFQLIAIIAPDGEKKLSDDKVTKELLLNELTTTPEMSDLFNYATALISFTLEEMANDGSYSFGGYIFNVLAELRQRFPLANASKIQAKMITITALAAEAAQQKLNADEEIRDATPENIFALLKPEITELLKQSDDFITSEGIRNKFQCILNRWDIESMTIQEAASTLIALNEHHPDVALAAYKIQTDPSIDSSKIYSRQEILTMLLSAHRNQISGVTIPEGLITSAEKITQVKTTERC